MPKKGCKGLIKHALAVHDRLTLLLVEHVRLIPTEIHKLRVSVKELRALWQVLKPLLPEDQADAASRDVKVAAKLLSAARDQYVQLKTLETLISKTEAEDLPALRHAREQLVAQQEDSTEDVRMTAEIISLFRQDQKRWQELELSCSRSELIFNGCGRLYRKAQKHFRKAATSGNAEDWHRLRHLIKYLALSLPVVVAADAAKADSKNFVNLAAKLGDLHDLHIMETRLRALTDQDDPLIRQAVALVKGRADSLQHKCLKKALRLFHLVEDRGPQPK